jgi:hypothetical protein
LPDASISKLFGGRPLVERNVEYVSADPSALSFERNPEPVVKADSKAFGVKG